MYTLVHIKLYTFANLLWSFSIKKTETEKMRGKRHCCGSFQIYRKLKIILEIIGANYYVILSYLTLVQLKIQDETNIPQFDRQFVF